jgi:HNH endonuclease
MPEVDTTIRYAAIKDFPGYMVGTDGSVWSCWHQVSKGYRSPVRWQLGDSWRQMQAVPNRQGQMKVTICPGRLTRFVHRLILEAFVGPCPPNMECRHFPDRDPANNALTNLQWGTKKQNQADRIFHGTDKRGEAHGMSRLTDNTVAEIRARYAKGGITTVQLAKKFKVGKTTIKNVIHRRTWQHVH